MLLALVVVLGITFVVFMIMQIVPGDPARVILGPYASDESVAGLRARLGLDRPFLEQYLVWLSKAVRGDFGQSLLNSQDIAPQLRGRIGPSFELAMVSLVIGLVIAFPIGIISALKPGSAIDIIATIFSQIGVSVPSFWMGILLIIVFSLNLNLLPPSGYTPIWEDAGDWLAHIILPACTAGFVSASIQTRFIRSAMLDVLNANYVQTARAKGLPERTVITRHALRNALINIVTIIGLQITALVQRHRHCRGGLFLARAGAAGFQRGRGARLSAIAGYGHGHRDHGHPGQLVCRSLIFFARSTDRIRVEESASGGVSLRLPEQTCGIR